MCLRCRCGLIYLKGSLLPQKEGEERFQGKHTTALTESLRLLWPDLDSLDSFSSYLLTHLHILLHTLLCFFPVPLCSCCSTGSYKVRQWQGDAVHLYKNSAQEERNLHVSGLKIFYKCHLQRAAHQPDIKDSLSVIHTDCPSVPRLPAMSHPASLKISGPLSHSFPE